MTWDWVQVQSAKAGVTPPTRPTFITVNGTGSPNPFDWGFAGEVGAALDDEVWYWQPIAYPAATFPMGPSVQVGVQEVLRQIDLHPGKFGMSGYSQGSLVTDYVWRDHLLTGSHAHRKDDCIAIVNFGDPMRATGISNGNLRAGFPIPGPLDGTPTGGIAGANNLTADQTPPFLMSCNNNGDLYGAAPGGTAGADEQLIFDFIQNISVGNIISIIQAVLPLLNPAADISAIITALPSILIGLIAGGSISSLSSNASNVQIIGFIEALLNGGMFVISGFGPHGDYEKMVPAMVEYVMEVGRAA